MRRLRTALLIVGLVSLLAGTVLDRSGHPALSAALFIAAALCLFFALILDVNLVITD